MFSELGSKFLKDDRTTFIDEYQKAPEILSHIKHRLNNANSFGKFIISGSTSFDALPVGTQSLTGRIDRLNILPLTQTEILKTDSNFLEELIKNHTKTFDKLDNTVTNETYQNYMKKVAIGGFPLSLSQDDLDSRYRWFENYVEYSINHDISEIIKIRQYSEMVRLLARLTKSSASVLNISKVCEDTGLSISSARVYISLLEKIFMIHKLPPSTIVKTDRLARHPKLHFVDSGIATHLLELDEESVLEINKTTSTNNGHLIETFVVNEIIRLSQTVSNIKKVAYWRTRTGEEIDIILELRGNKTIAVEVKNGVNISKSDFKHIYTYKELAGDKFVCGIVFYTGDRVVRYGDDLVALPIDCLWRDRQNAEGLASDLPQVGLPLASKC